MQLYELRRARHGELTELEYELAGQLVVRTTHDDTEEKFLYSLLGDLVAVEVPNLRLSASPSSAAPNDGIYVTASRP